MVNVRDGQFVTQFVKNECQANRIRATGYSDQNAIMRFEYLVLVNGLSDLGDKLGKHGEMPEGGLEPPT